MRRYFLFFLISFQSYFCFSLGNGRDTALLVVSTFNLKNNLVKNIHVNLYIDDKRIDSTIVDGNQAFGFYLKRNVIYAIEIEKEGFIKKTVGVSTKLPDYAMEKPYFKFSFQVPLDKIGEEEKKIKGIFDFPTAVIYYNDATGQFDYGLDETRVIKKKKKKKK